MKKGELVVFVNKDKKVNEGQLAYYAFTSCTNKINGALFIFKDELLEQVMYDHILSDVKELVDLIIKDGYLLDKLNFVVSSANNFRTKEQLSNLKAELIMQNAKCDRFLALF